MIIIKEHMNPEIKARWVAWLRANPDKQAKGQLRRGDSFCCLGVLCELAVADKVIGPPRESERPGRPIYGCIDHARNHDESATILPDAVRTWAGLESCDPYVKLPTGSYSLSWLNDHECTFAQIADLIEEQL